MSQECKKHLESLGIKNNNIEFNLQPGQLYEFALLPEHKYSKDPLVEPTAITYKGALAVSSGEKTGRSPKDKRVVLDETTKDEVWWGDVNMPISPMGYARCRQRAIDYLNKAPRLFIVDGFAGWDPTYRLKCRVICARPYHALFMKQMMIRGKYEDTVREFKQGGPDFTIFNAGEFPADPLTEDVKTQTAISVNFKERELTILGSQYAGEMKKGLFGVMHYYMPAKGALSMHASANEGKKGDTTILFGLSGTGKTTLSADPNRALIGDDEHVWTDKGIFNIEGGCYAKAINLREEKEPEIYHAIKFGAILENTKFYGDEQRPRTTNYDDTSITENTRVCYPLEHIPGVKIPAVGGHPKNIIFLTCDAQGVLPPVAKLTPEQSMYHFISGYTAKVAGTEMGVKEPQATFSACFGEAFLPRHPYLYAKMLAEMSSKHKTNVWLVNTGWSGGMYGEGERMSLKITRSILDSIHSGELNNAEYEVMEGFNLNVPKHVSNVPSEILMPINTWKDKQAYHDQVSKLAHQFIENFKKYEDGTPKEVVELGGPHESAAAEAKSHMPINKAGSDEH